MIYEYYEYQHSKLGLEVFFFVISQHCAKTETGQYYLVNLKCYDVTNVIVCRGVNC